MGNQVGLCEVLGGLEEKITLIEKAHQINPKDTNILRALAYASFTKGDRKHGLAALILGLKIEPENKALIIFFRSSGLSA
ncbi:hypothetical protein [sulfur-oxidizing endosymbiont of Gigantopelta aegis]|uniref:hypothetical protein n=1 Tax=sulfur-oxidizing endosymbiont of Gigantopelta aegis TaxID=2794934 RepID=UPI0018DC810B|nr:hypothetical protein [sulfur-oxidizing endosymbiont of Gigantopelta aegis]